MTSMDSELVNIETQPEPTVFQNFKTYLSYIVSVSSNQQGIIKENEHELMSKLLADVSRRIDESKQELSTSEVMAIALKEYIHSLREEALLGKSDL